MKDILGKEIEVGDFVIRSRVKETYLDYGLVYKISNKKIHICGTADLIGINYWPATQKIVVIDFPPKELVISKIMRLLERLTNNYCSPYGVLYSTLNEEYKNLIDRILYKYCIDIKELIKE